jgi:hypothetical protein
MAEKTGEPQILTETPEEIAYEQRGAEGALWTGSRLLVGIGVFAMASLAFAYSYLRSSITSSCGGRAELRLPRPPARRSSR